MHNKWNWLTNNIRSGMGLLPLVTTVALTACRTDKTEEPVDIQTETTETTTDTATTTEPDTSTETTTGTDTSTGTETSTDPEDGCGAAPELTNDSYSDIFESGGTYTVCGILPDEASCLSLDEITPWRFLESAITALEDDVFCWLDGVALCGPIESINDQCCYEFEVAIACKGRPYSVDGEARLAKLEENEEWPHRIKLDSHQLSTTERFELTRQWSVMGQQEHASIASFARFALHLVSLGAPPDLIAQTNRAMQDELLHAQLVFGVASSLAGRPLGVGAMDLGQETAGFDMAEMLEAAILEGCIVETITVAQMAEARDRCTKKSIRNVLHKIVVDESRHSSLAWQFVHWMLSKHPELEDAAARAFAKGKAAILSQVAEADKIDEDILLAYGRLPKRLEVQVAQEVLEQVIGPNQQLLFQQAKAC